MIICESKGYQTFTMLKYPVYNGFITKRNWNTTKYYLFNEKSETFFGCHFYSCQVTMESRRYRTIELLLYMKISKLYWLTIIKYCVEYILKKIHLLMFYINIEMSTWWCNIVLYFRTTCVTQQNIKRPVLQDSNIVWY